MELTERNCRPAESSFEAKICEVHSGVDLVKEIGFSSSQIRITHVTCIEWKMFDIFYKSGTAELTSSLDIAGDEVFYFSEMSPMHKIKSIREQEKRFC